MPNAKAKSPEAGVLELSSSMGGDDNDVVQGLGLSHKFNGEDFPSLPHRDYSLHNVLCDGPVRSWEINKTGKGGPKFPSSLL